MNGITARLAAALLLLAGVPGLLGGCVGEAADDEGDPAEPTASSEAPVQPTRTTLTRAAVVDAAKSRSVADITSASTPTASDPEPQPWDPNNPHATTAH